MAGINEGSDRPTVPRRADYLATGREDRFIVPLLRELIEGGIDRHATPTPPGSRALDVGCGRQPFRAKLEAMGYTYIGNDVVQNPDALIEVIGAIDAPPDSDAVRSLTRSGPYQFILCTEVLEHVADWDAAFRNLAAVMAPGGRLLITCPHLYPPHEEPYDFWRPTLHALNFFARRVGLATAEQQAAGSPSEVVGTVIAQVQFRTASTSFLRRSVRNCFAALRQFVIAVLDRNKIPSPVDIRTGLYLVNYIVLVKP